MDRRPLGRSDILVSRCCLGTMTWGQQNSEAEAHAQLDRAVARGVNFIDTAELYPVPRDRETQGRTEQYIGSWLAKRGQRDDVVIATKVIGRSDAHWFRPWNAEPRVDARNIDYAIEQSLKRLRTDVIDLYQVHWPDRRAPMFGAGWYTDYPADYTRFEDVLAALDKHIDKGSIRAIGVSNETPWGVMQYLVNAQMHGAPRIVSIQNAYHLLNRTFEEGLAEMSLREDVGLMAYSPLAFGYLTGKYQAGIPAGSRGDLFPQFMQRYDRPEVRQALERYLTIASDHAMTPAQLALRFVDTRPFTGATIIGATSLEQLDANLDAFDAPWSEEIEAAVNAAHTVNRNPCP